MIDKLAIKLYINGCTGCIVTTGRYSTFLLTVDPPVAKKKNVRKIRKFFSPSMLPVRCEKRIVLSTTIRVASCTPYVQKNMYQISRKITKRSVNDSTNRLLKREKKKKHCASLHFSSSFFITRARGDERVANQIRSTQRGNRNNSMTEGDAGNQTRSSSPSFNEFHALLCPYSFARARVHAYPTRSSR